MTVLIESDGSHRSRGRSVDAAHTIEIAGVHWPAHKLYAVVAAAAAALVVLLVTRSPESAAWSSAATGVAVWFAVGCLTRGQRPGNAATEPAE